jgi:hypothetical protein
MFFLLFLQFFLPYVLFLHLKPLHSVVLLLLPSSHVAELSSSSLTLPLPSIYLCFPVLIHLLPTFTFFFISSIPHHLLLLPDVGSYV